VTPEKAAQLTDRETAQLIFAPGFSTAEHVSTLSGRGVGMDVVKTNIDKVGGTIDITTKPGRGTQIRLRIPLTLAIVPAMIVRSESESFAIPQVKVQELVRVDMDTESARIELLQGQAIYRLRGELLPLVFMKDLLDLRKEKLSPGIHDKILNIVVLTTDGEPFGLVVDEIRDTADIVVKPLPQFLKRLRTYSGSTIMGDGTVSLIIDVGGIAQRGNIKTSQIGKKDKLLQSQTEASSRFIENQDLLFFGLHGAGRYCLPLILVNRLEEIPINQIETAGKEQFYQSSILMITSNFQRHQTKRTGTKALSLSYQKNDDSSVLK
jgi:two-component system chemotaxis sensor kinase CheA